MDISQFREIISHFPLHGEIVGIDRFGNGHINDSYFIGTAGDDIPDYILQRINHSIFKDVELLQRNIDCVTRHIRRKLENNGTEDIDRKVLKFIAAIDGRMYHFDGENYWRVMVHIPCSLSYEAITPEYSRFAGLAFGQFQSMLADIPDTLGEVIPDFHNMEFRLRQLDQAATEDKAGRLSGVRDIVDRIKTFKQEMTFAERLYREGKLPKRVCHCDTKVNNILFDEAGGILCVVDLDTVMPSYVFSDYGDFLRSAANTGAEDDADLDNVRFDMDIFEAFTDGYLESAGGFLTRTEIENLPYAAAMFPYMQAVRFFADYINGDTYYKTKYPEHNLVRTRAQMRLFDSAYEAIPRMKEYIAGKWNVKP